LKLTELVYAGQDWGGPVGMGALARSPDLLKGVVVLNTFFNAANEEGDLSRGHAIAKRPVVGEFLIEVLALIFENLPKMQGDPDSLPPDVLELYSRPVKESGNDKAPLAMMRMVPDGPDHPTTPAMRVIERYVQGLDIPAEIIWGINDPILVNHLPAIKQNFPNAPVTETEGGHFLQEEVPVEIAAALLRVVAQGRSPNR
jgi:haloalkane dehalogenase